MLLTVLSESTVPLFLLLRVGQGISLGRHVSIGHVLVWLLDGRVEHGLLGGGRSRGCEVVGLQLLLGLLKALLIQSLLVLLLQLGVRGHVHGVGGTGGRHGHGHGSRGGAKVLVKGLGRCEGLALGLLHHVGGAGLVGHARRHGRSHVLRGLIEGRRRCGRHALGRLMGALGRAKLLALHGGGWGGIGRTGVLEVLVGRWRWLKRLGGLLRRNKGSKGSILHGGLRARGIRSIWIGTRRGGHGVLARTGSLGGHDGVDLVGGIAKGSLGIDATVLHALLKGIGSVEGIDVKGRVGVAIVGGVEGVVEGVDIERGVGVPIVVAVVIVVERAHGRVHDER